MSTVRTANAVLENKTRHNFTNAAVVHRYSDDAQVGGTWKDVKIDQTTTPFAVTYRTGFFTTGQDWWIVSWVDDEGHVWVTSPRNGRKFVDVLERIWQVLGSFGAAAGGDEKALDAQEKLMEHWVGTASFKSFILRAKDQNTTVKIAVVEDQKDHFTVKYSAPSGDDEGNPVKRVS